MGDQGRPQQEHSHCRKPRMRYNLSRVPKTINMRVAIRFLAILTLAALLAPSVRWASLHASGDECACPPAACTCAFHHHAAGHDGSCSMANRGKCGMNSHDSLLNSLLGSLVYVPIEHHWNGPAPSGRFGRKQQEVSLLPSHLRIPEQPPRLAI